MPLAAKAKRPRSAGALAVEALAAGLAHEVRNPLNALRINLSILEQELAQVVPDRGAHVFEVARRLGRELRSLDDFVSEFLRFARRPRLKLETVDIRELLSDLATFIASECTRKGVKLSLGPLRGPRTLQADATQLKHAVLNLVLNALQATPPGGRVRIETEGDKHCLQLRVLDRGEGIEPEALAHVFDAFYSLREGGTGLGLPIAQRIASAHGGTLALHSRPGQGTVATLCLPLRPAAPARRALTRERKSR